MHVQSNVVHPIFNLVKIDIPTFLFLIRRLIDRHMHLKKLLSFEVWCTRWCSYHKVEGLQLNWDECPRSRWDRFAGYKAYRRRAFCPTSAVIANGTESTVRMSVRASLLVRNTRMSYWSFLGPLRSVKICKRHCRTSSPWHIQARSGDIFDKRSQKGSDEAPPNYEGDKQPCSKSTENDN